MDEIARKALDPVGRMHRNYDAGIQSSPGASTPDMSSTSRPRIKRIARKPLKIASAAIGRRKTSSDSATSSAAAASSQNLRMTASLQAHAQAQDTHAAAATDDVIAKGEAYKIAKDRAKPLEGEKEACVVRIRVVRCENLVAKDRGNTSDPFVTLSLPACPTVQTPVVKKSLSPQFPSDASTFDFPLYSSLARAGWYRGRGLELVVWDKDLVRKEYLGELSIPIQQWFVDDGLAWREGLSALRYSLVSTRRSVVTGSVFLEIGIVASDDARAAEHVHQLSRVSGQPMVSLLTIPAHEGIGTTRLKPRRKVNGPKSAISVAAQIAMRQIRRRREPSGAQTPVEAESDESSEELHDDGLSSDESEEDSSGPMRADSQDSTMPIKEETEDDGLAPLPRDHGPNVVVLDDESETDGGVPQRPPRRRLFSRRSLKSGSQTPGMLTPGASTPSGPQTPGSTRQRRRLKRRKDRGYHFTDNTDILGIVMLEINSASDLPRLKGAFRWGYDMDPFVVVSFGKKVFRTRVLRHNLNPVWDEKLLFHVRRYEDTFSIQFAVLDWDKISGNDHVGSISLPIQELMADAPRPNEAGLFQPDQDGKHDMKEFRLPIIPPKDSQWETKHAPTLHFRAKYEPYDALRQRFWRQYLQTYDTDDTGAISVMEFTTMLDSLGSTLSTQTIEGYWKRHGKQPEQDELTYDELVQSLEEAIRKPSHERAKVEHSSDAPTPYHDMAPRPAADGLDVAGPTVPPPHASQGVDPKELAAHIRASEPGDDANVKPLSEGGYFDRVGTPEVMSPSDSPHESEDEGDDVERVVNIKTCPLCHQPRLKRKSEADIITHLAVCASTDWSRVDRMIVGNYVTASQAQRKYLTKIITSVAVGSYKLGANSANIIVQDRATGQLQEEKMAVYVRIGIRVLYKGAKSNMQGARMRRLLKSMSIKQGLKYDSPQSAAEIPAFIAFHNLNLDEIRDPIESYKTFNEFFYRRLKADARPISSPDDPNTLVSCADCRMMAFQTVNDATRIWIKGREFSVARLLGPTYKDVHHKFDGGALGIFRLAPQDYHRFHSPVDGVVGKSAFIDGQYYTVNPQAIRTTLDVYGENVRKIVPIESPQFGTVMTVWIGAMMVGSIGTSVTEGQQVRRGDELGWFAFGGSTIVCLFERGALTWDEDLLQNATQSIETLVRMGNGIGRAGGPTGPESDNGGDFRSRSNSARTSLRSPMHRAQTGSRPVSIIEEKGSGSPGVVLTPPPGV